MGLATFLWASQATAITAPRGVTVEGYARGINHPTNLAFDNEGRLWATASAYSTESSDGVWFVPRRGATPVHVVSGLYTALGLEWFRGELYVSHVVPYAAGAQEHFGRVIAYSGFDGERFRKSRIVIDDIPTGLHRVDTIRAGPDGRLYVGVGSAADNAPGSRYGGTVVSFEPDGSDLRIEARGLRNPYGLTFIPGTDYLLVSDNGRDDLGPDRPPEELNGFDVSGDPPDFGFPDCWGKAGGRCDGSEPPLAELAPHAAAGGVTVTEFGDLGLSAFVTEHGSTIRPQPTGSDVIRVPLRRTSAGYAAGKPETFARDFARYEPLGAVIGPGGGLYVGLWSSGRIVRFRPPATARRVPDSPHGFALADAFPAVGELLLSGIRLVADALTASSRSTASR